MLVNPPAAGVTIPAKYSLEDVHHLQNISASHSAGDFRKIS